ncbi:O-antigen polymerase [Aliarcobacter butzleri]|uniref:O-antigen polymerase n=1 Tax=Aliarcobacter butzleri TaxID=28197 RepID=UPI002B243F6E|nr:O-antigen polymerase [Aliarcobacter butzleri]
MNELILLYKILSIGMYGIGYWYIYKKLNKIEEKILFWNFFILFFIGGSLSALIFDYTNIIFPSSGMLSIETDILSWSIYFSIVFLLPILSILVTNKIFKFFSISETFQRTNLIFIYISLFLIIVYILFNTDMTNLLFNQAYKGYSESLENRYALQYSSSYLFIVKVLSFIFLLSLCIEYFNRGRKVLSFAYFVLSIVIYGIIDNFIFISKLYFIGFVFSYLVFLLIYMKKKYFIPIVVLVSISYISFYFYNIGHNYEAVVIEPILKGITRFTITIPYYIEYYMSNDFDMKIYFYSLLTGEKVISPNIRVFELMFDTSKMDVQGSLASGIFTYNYANFGILTTFISLFEVTVLIYLYTTITKNIMTSFNISIFSLLVFGIINYNFTTILVNPLIGYILLLGLLYILNYVNQRRIKL